MRQPARILSPSSTSSAVGGASSVIMSHASPHRQDGFGGLREEPSAVLLALWYISSSSGSFLACLPQARRRKGGTLGLSEWRDSGSSQATNAPCTIPSRLVLRRMHANKWLDDHAFSNKA
ncbi:hypothetical protein BJV77DRAFT_160152 [Russula vinacea]|nr:hypothetical protein BJV77DRAFT_160152 [Russula vinacea]